MSNVDTNGGGLGTAPAGACRSMVPGCFYHKRPPKTRLLALPRPVRSPACLRAARLVVGVVAWWLLASCEAPPELLAGGEPTLRVRISPELQPVVQQFSDMAARTGLAVQFSPAFSDAETDAHWGVGIGQARDGQGLMAFRLYPAPVVLGVKADLARAFGWCQSPWWGGVQPDGHVTWAELAARAGAGELRFALPNPAYSELGAATINALHFGVQGAATPANDRLQAVQDFGRGHRRLYPDYVEAGAHYLRYESELDALFAPAELITTLNADPRLQTPLCSVWIMDATPLPGYTLGLFNRLKRREFTALAQYLASRAHAVNARGATVRPAPEWRKSHDLRVLVRAYLEHHLAPAALLIAINTTPAIGRGLRTVKDGLRALLDHREEQERFSRLRHGEQLRIVPYDRELRPGFAVTLDRARNDELAGVRGYLDKLALGGAGPGMPAPRVAAGLAALAPTLVDPARGTRLNLLVLTDSASAEQLVAHGGWEAFSTAFVIGIDRDQERLCFGSLQDPGARLRCQTEMDLGALLLAVRGHQ